MGFGDWCFWQEKARETRYFPKRNTIFSYLILPIYLKELLIFASMAAVGIIQRFLMFVGLMGWLIKGDGSIKNIGKFVIECLQKTAC